MAVATTEQSLHKTQAPLTKWLALVLSLCTAVVLWKLRNIQQIADSLGIAYDVRAGKDLFNPHHLLFGPSVRIVYDVMHAVGISTDAIKAAQVFNIGWSVVSVVSFFLIVYKVTSRYGFAILAALSLLFANTFWQFSTQSEVYIAATGPIMLMLSWLVLLPVKQLKPFTLTLITLLLFLSISYHQTGVLLLVPLWIYYYQQHGKNGLRFMAVLTIASGLLTLLVYISVYLSLGHGFSIDGFIHYCLEYAYLNPDWGTVSHFKSGSEWIKIFGNQASAFIPEWLVQKIPVKAIAIAFIALWGYNITAAIRRTPHYTLRTFALVWLGTFYLFLVWWTAGYEFFVLTIPPTLLLLLFMIHDVTSWLGHFRRFETPIVEEAYHMFVPLLVLGLLIRLNMPNMIKYHRVRDEGYLQAQRAKELCGTCKIVTNFNIMTNLSYHQNYLNSVESDGLYIAYYYKDSIPKKYQLRRDSCVLMELWYLNPWYNSLGKNGFDFPDKYLSVVDNIFDVRQLGNHMVCKDFSIAANNIGQYIKIGPNKRELKNYEQLFTALDDSINAKQIKNQAVFKRWYFEKGKDVIRR